MDSIMPIYTTTLYHFHRVTDPELLKIISGMNKTSCSSDPFPTRLLMSHLYAIVPILYHIVTRLTMIIYSTYSRNMSELVVVHYG